MRPNVRGEAWTDGGTPGPGWRKCTAYRQTGPGGPPLGLASTEGLGPRAAKPVPEATRNRGDKQVAKQHEVSGT
jgi:hypothetical protein